MIIDEVKKETVKSLLKEGRRLDGRGIDDYRPIFVEKDIISSAEGSARVRIGDSHVIVGIKVDPAVPFPDRPDEGTLTTSADLLPLASPTFETGPPRVPAIELARIVDRGIRSAEAIDLKALYRNEEKVWGIYIDIYTMDHDGNLIDAAGLAAVAALMDLKIPKYEDEKVLRGPEYYTTLKLREVPTYCTYCKIGDRIIADPTFLEELAADAKLTISNNDSQIFAFQKTGTGSFKRQEIMDMVDRSFARWQELKRYIEQ
ncbi:MAG: exosome complex protein Rrp42 [Candidatus Micrarchaeia archaeon]